MIVLKFGGTSVQDSASMNGALEITRQYLSQAPLLVSSAMSGVTNDLVALTQKVGSGDSPGAWSLVEAVEKRHRGTLAELVTGVNLQEGLALLEEVFTEVRALVKGSLLLKECSKRVYDAILAMGELLSTRLLWCRCRELGWEAVLLDSRRLIVTDDRFGEAAVLWPQTTETVQRAVRPRSGCILITQGFIGATEKGVTTTLGRGGSDYSGAIFGAVLGAEEVQIWTDVNGMMTTDPRKVPSARTIPKITYSEAAELAYFGAKVVHPATIQPAVEKGIPVLVKNTKNPTHPGTMISRSAEGKGLRAIAGKKDITLITVTSSRMLNAYGFLYRIFEIFHNHKTPVDLVATSEVSVSMTIEDARDIRGIKQALESLGTVKVEKDCAILCLVGPELWKDPHFIQRVFSALPGMAIRMVSLGSSEINLSVVIGQKDLDRALVMVHEEFFPE